uniref:Amino group transfer protein n=1 Tax=Delftia acidovorans TaxID=80866 RepID=Q842F4_DELAC|nr:amino group transfer protein [Delftia acidovorans]
MDTVKKKYAVLWCTEVPGDEILQEKMIATFGRAGEQWDVLEPARDGFLERAMGYDGYVISGSPMSVVDDADSLLVSNLLALIRRVSDEAGSPLIGLCFGSQAIAAALGGRVARNPSGRFKLGVEALRWDPVAVELLGAALAQAPSVLVQSHGECVAALPPGSVLLASSQTIPHEVFLVQGRILGIQGHPEVDRQFLKDKFMAYHRALFDDEQWAHVEQEASQPLSPDAVIALGRRLLDEGALAPAAVPTLTETT